ncbi:glyoxalase [Halovulum dunhuangense]|uniref:Glyoxalase n=1 Tax=Halovulum dunhuangense TaxID=1505036 RepID=A0A849KRM0_9RHOB|nr:VOC family protein [Halovulum dunhuangense]NNU79499.1 glyoxalase [Halovulum dunhuangense]
MIVDLDHLNLRTVRLQEMIDWYGAVLGMEPGPRPDFPFAGAWLYAGERALVHLVEVAEEAPAAPPGGLRLEHGAFRGRGFAAFVEKLTNRGERMRISRVPGFPVVQVNVWDPDGNHLHIDFDEAEVPPHLI